MELPIRRAGRDQRSEGMQSSISLNNYRRPSTKPTTQLQSVTLHTQTTLNIFTFHSNGDNGIFGSNRFWSLHILHLMTEPF